MKTCILVNDNFTVFGTEYKNTKGDLKYVKRMVMNYKNYRDKVFYVLQGRITEEQTKWTKQLVRLLICMREN